MHTQAKVIADQDAMYKYISKNMLFVATVSPKATGPIGSATPEEASLVVYLVDTVTGRILHRATHLASQAPVHAVSSVLLELCIVNFVILVFILFLVTNFGYFCSVPSETIIVTLFLFPFAIISAGLQ